MTDAYVGDGVTLPTTPDEALDLLAGYVDVVGDTDEREDISEAFALLRKFVDRAKPVLASIDDDTYDEWGDYGDCIERLDTYEEGGENDDALLLEDRDELSRLMREYREQVGDAWVIARLNLGVFAAKLKIGRHYGTHCIYCLQAP